jgi:hypothetical protein
MGDEPASVGDGRDRPAELLADDPAHLTALPTGARC